MPEFLTPVQLALFVVGFAAALAIWFVSRRGRDTLRDWSPDKERGVLRGPQPPKGEQLDMFNATGQFDEFGVGKARRRQAVAAAASAAAAAPAVGPASDAGAASPPPERAPVLPKTIALLVAEREGTHIMGPRIHTALKSHGLQFGVGEIYHRMSGGEPVFSAAGLLKPGTLNPAEAMKLSTPGLSMFISLPGPLPPVTAFREFVGSAQSLAQALNADLLDMRKRPLDGAALAQLESDVEAWARAHPMA